MTWSCRLPRLPLLILLFTATIALINLKLGSKVARLPHDTEFASRRFGSHPSGGQGLGLDHTAAPVPQAGNGQHPGLHSDTASQSQVRSDQQQQQQQWREWEPVRGSQQLPADSSGVKKSLQIPSLAVPRPALEQTARQQPAQRQGVQQQRLNAPQHAQQAQRQRPSVRSVRPASGPAAGGLTLLIRGQGFGGPETLLQARIGGIPCLQTRIFSHTALHCLLPPGHGIDLPVTVHPCACGPAAKPLPDAASEQPPRATARFSYAEDLVAKVVEGQAQPMPQPLLQGLQVRMTQQQLVGKYEVRFTDYRSRQSGFFMLEPDVGPLLPPEDYTTRFETCALVGKQGTLLGSGLGPVIDSHDAVFRMDNCPTTAKHVDNVGLKTTFAVLAEDWAQALLGVEEVGVGPFVHRWWADGGAAVVMWEEASQYSFTQLMNLYPTSNTLLLSRDLVTFTQALAGRLKDGMERHLNASLQVSKVSSLMVAAVLASQICGRVDVYGVLPRCSGRNDYECRRTSYFDDFEPSLAVQDSQELERWLLIHLHQRGLVNLDTPEWVALDANGGLVLGELPHLAQSIGQPGVCDAQQCQPRCSGHGRFEAGACVCAAAFSGPDCSQNRILAHSDAILRGVDMHFDGALLLSQQQVVVDMLSQTYHIPLPQHEAQHRQGGSYLINKEMRHALPANDTWLWEALSTRPQSGTSIAAHLSPRLPNSQATRMQRRTLGRCALVGNAGAQLHHSYGAEIDAHDVVVRFNQGPLRGFEESLGTRTSLEIINKAWMSQLLEGIKSVSPTTRISRHAWDWREPGTALGVYEMFDPASFAFRMSHQIADKEEWWRQAYKKFRRIFPEHPLVALSPHFVVWANQKYAELKAGVQAEGLGSYAGEKPMSGFYAVLLCVQVCEELDVYGFTPYQEADRLDPLAPRYHYFDAAVPRPSSHSFDLADYIYQLLANLTDAIRVFD